MEIQTFEGTSMKDAIKEVKQTFGKDAVILESKQKQREGRVLYQVKAVSGKPASHHPQDNMPFDGMPTARDPAMDNELLTTLKQIDQNVCKKEQLDIMNTSIFQIKNLILDVLNEKGFDYTAGLPPSAQKIMLSLKSSDVDEGYLIQIADYLKSLPMRSDSQSRDEADYFHREHALRWMMKRIKLAPKLGMDPHKMVHCVIGSLGSGKTTFACNLAVHLQKRLKQKVCVISYDNLKLGAADHLRVYSKVLNFSFEQAMDLPDLERKVLQCLREEQLVVIDHHARPMTLNTYAQELIQLKETELDPCFHLLLPLHHRRLQLDKAIRYFMSIGIESLNFSHIDEAISFGDIFNLSHHWGIPLGFFVTSNNMPQGFERASRERVVEKIFGL